MLETSNLLFLAGILLMTFTMVRMLRRRAKASQAPALSAPAGEHVLAQPNIGQYEARLFDTFRELNARLETKIAVLDALVDEANRTIDRLQSTRQPKLDSATDEPLVVGIERTTAELSIQPRNQPPPFDREEIHALADSGLPAARIAEKLNLPLAEIELALCVRNRRNSR